MYSEYRLEILKQEIQIIDNTIMNEHCKKHQSKIAISFCHACNQYYCADCLTEGIDYYYCYKDECQEALSEEGKFLELDCLNCGMSILLKKEEAIARAYHCEHCQKTVRYSQEYLTKFIKTEQKIYELPLEDLSLSQILLSLNTSDNPYIRMYIYENSGIEAILISRNEFSLSYYYQANDFYYEATRNDITSTEVIHAFKEFQENKHDWKEAFEWREVPLTKGAKFAKFAPKLIKIGLLIVIYLVLVFAYHWIEELIKYYKYQ